MGMVSRMSMSTREGGCWLLSPTKRECHPMNLSFYHLSFYPGHPLPAGVVGAAYQRQAAAAAAEENEKCS